MNANRGKMGIFVRDRSKKRSNLTQSKILSQSD